MLAAYVTTDDVNSALAQQFAEECQTQIHDLRPGEMPSDLAFDAVVYDLDDLPAEHRCVIIAELLAAPSPRAVAVHSYTLDDREETGLSRNGVVVARRLEAESSSGWARRLQMRG